MIRRAQNTKAEIEKISIILNEAAKKGSVLPRTAGEIEGVIDSFFVAVREGEIIGCCAVEIYNPKLAEVRSLAIMPEFHGQGYGGELVKACIAEVRKQNVYEILTITDKDIFFEKQGFANVLNGQKAMFIKLK